MLEISWGVVIFCLLVGLITSIKVIGFMETIQNIAATILYIGFIASIFYLSFHYIRLYHG